ncbi:transposase family protein [Saccharopolyspora sp. ASAGF58]|uniref:transposase family protein n=1 Tax=Saccharopolyspora sp. ASAGF58 TaxID=2719023 RepID=UPI00143FC2D8|nr:transposase family protein [Saccharopolyspora sp. ASAGF58]QIZ38736.1 transposase family protein [Saccharopolyspora sp. ASAGF58]
MKLLGKVPDRHKRKGRVYSLAFLLAASLIAVLAGASNFRQIADQVADLPASLRPFDPAENNSDNPCRCL